MWLDAQRHELSYLWGMSLRESSASSYCSRHQVLCVWDTVMKWDCRGFPSCKYDIYIMSLLILTRSSVSIMWSFLFIANNFMFWGGGESSSIKDQWSPYLMNGCVPPWTASNLKSTWVWTLNICFLPFCYLAYVFPYYNTSFPVGFSFLNFTSKFPMVIMIPARPKTSVGDRAFPCLQIL